MATTITPHAARPVTVVDDVDVARQLLDPLRSRVLAALAVPGSSSSVAAALGEPRQKINHHLRALESAGLVELVEERPRRGLTERIVVATSEALVLAPGLVGDNALRVRSDEQSDSRLSARYLLAVAARLVSEVGSLVRRAHDDGRPLATLTIDTEIRFRSSADRALFTQRLGAAVQQLTAEHHDEAAPGGRWHRLVVCAHPRPAHEPSEATT